MCSQTHTPLCHLPAVLLCRTSGLMMSFLWCAPMQKGKPRGFMWGGFGGGGAMFPLRRLRGQLVNNGSTGEVCLLGRSHPFITACAPRCPKQGFLCVRLFMCVLPNLFISRTDLVLPELERKNWACDSGWAELIEAFLCFCLATCVRNGFIWTTSVTFFSCRAFPGL